MTSSQHPEPEEKSGTVFEVFAAFLKLGLTSFGGPVAHLGYFRLELVERRRWVSEGQYAQLVAICQFLPGPSSSQLGFSLGLLRAGWWGALAAFAAFTIPSALMLFGFAMLMPSISGEMGEAAVHGLKLVAVAVVAHGVLGMTRRLCPDVSRASIAAVAAATAVLVDSGMGQLGVVVVGAVAGVLICREAGALTVDELPIPHGWKAGWSLVATCFVLLVVLPLTLKGTEGLGAIAVAFYQAGALVFGGGHVVLPLLEETVVSPGWITQEEFLAGYGAAQAVPGPMFSFAAYLGAGMSSSIGAGPGAATAVIAIFLPGLLLVSGALPIWRSLASHPKAVRAIAGINAAVVGILGAALYDPVWTTAVNRPIDFAIAVIGFMLLVVWRISALFVVGWCVAASVLAAVTVG